MPWSTPSLQQVRQQNRDYLTGKLGVPIIPNSVARVLADANGGNAHLNLQYLDWLSLQLVKLAKSLTNIQECAVLHPNGAFCV